MYNDKIYNNLFQLSFIPENNTFQVNGYTFGIFQDVLERLQIQLNFSTIQYKRKEQAWGMIYEEPNGTYHGTGIVGDIFFKRADLAVAPLTIAVERAKFIDFLPPIKPDYVGMYVLKISGHQMLDLHLIISPFAQDSWMLIIITSTIIATVKLGILKFYGMKL